MRKFGLGREENCGYPLLDPWVSDFSWLAARGYRSGGGSENKLAFQCALPELTYRARNRDSSPLLAKTDKIWPK